MPTSEDALPFQVAKAISNVDLKPALTGAIKDTGFDESRYLSSISRAVETLRSANLSKEEINHDPGFLDTAAAAFRQSNTIVSEFSSHINAVVGSLEPDTSNPMSREEVANRAEKDGLPSSIPSPRSRALLRSLRSHPLERALVSR